MELIQFDSSQITKTQIENYVEHMVEAIKSGHINPIEAAIMIKAQEEVLKKVRKEVDELVMTKAEEYAKGERYWNGVEFQVTKGRTTYDFSEDSKYQDLKAQLKAREEYLKARPAFDPDTGEVNPMKVKEGKDFLTLKFPKQL